jgi:sphingolipid delta-4 desaturase
MSKLDFVHTDAPQVHLAQRREVLSRHPEIRALAGAWSGTAAVILLLVASQFGLAWLASELGWGWMVLLAYLAGAPVSHALYVMIHECTHDLAWRTQRGNRALGLVCDLPLGFPSFSAFRVHHLLHHRYMGELVMDPDVVSEREARLVGNRWWRKTIWMALFSLSQALRPLKTENNEFWDRQAFLNVGLVIVANLLVLLLLGPVALVFLFLSTFFALGLHPLGGRWLQEHYLTRPGQETYSYYGPGNWIAFNVGYHNEHHDFMNVAWCRLPRLRELGRDHYDSLKSYRSWTAVLLRFLFDPRMSAFSRMIHPDTRSEAKAARRKAQKAMQGATSTSTV